jgi:hypothetical protein
MYRTQLKGLITAAVLLTPTLGHTAQYRLGTPFPMTCEGVLSYKDGGYFLNRDDTHLNSDSEHDAICNGATIAEETGHTSTKYTLREKTIIQVLKACSLGHLCEIAGQMNGISHDIWFWVAITSVRAK